MLTEDESGEFWSLIDDDGFCHYSGSLHMVKLVVDTIEQSFQCE